MKYILTSLLLLFSIATFAQNTAAHKLFNKYEDQKGFTSVLISEYAFQLIADVTEDEEEVFNEAASMIKGVRIITADSSNLAPNFLADLKKTFRFKSNAYKPLMTVKSDGDQVLFYLKEQNKKIKEFVLLVESPTAPVMILIEGDNINLKKLKNLAGKTDIDAFDVLDKMN